MGISSTYSGKGSSSVRSRKTVKPTKEIETVQEMLELLQEVEIAREKVGEKEKELADAKKKLQTTEKKVADKLKIVNPDVRKRLINMLGGSIDKSTESR